MKKTIILTISFFSLGLAGCLKDTPNVDFSSVGTIIEFEYPSGGGGSGLGSGLEYFGGGALTYPPTDAVDTATFMVNIASPSPLSSDLTVTLGVDANALLDHYATDSIKFVKMPDSLYKIISTSAVIKAGSRLATFKIAFYPSKVDPTQNYGLPITVANSGGYTVSGNFGHIYFHTIGNPLAGVYSVTGTRYNYTGTIAWSGPPAAVPAGYVSTTDLSGVSPELGSPDNTHTIEIGFSNLGSSGYNYVITANSSYSSISVDYNFDAIYSNIINYVVSYSPPSAGKPAFHIVTHYNNATGGSGNDRIIDQSFVHQ